MNLFLPYEEPISFHGYLMCKVKAFNQGNYKKLTRMLQYIEGTIDLPCTLFVDGLWIVKWWVNALHATRKNMKSQTGGQCHWVLGVFTVCHEHKS
jgi:hypothetical protein